MAQTVWQVLDSVAAGGALWLSVVFVLAVLGEIGLPFTCIIIETLFIFTGFELIHGASLVAALPLLATAGAGRLLGSTFFYRFSGGFGTSIIGRFGPRIGVTPKSVAMLTDRLARLLLPTIVIVRFIPGFTILPSFICGATAVGRRKFATAILAHIAIWEAAFIMAGTLGALASRSLDPSTYPLTLAIIIAIVLTIATANGYVILHRLHRLEGSEGADYKTGISPDPSMEGRRRVSATKPHAS
ncbi:MAG: hypothetical protein JW846_04650 [Dehalococcoidia bacterium]|nr:hypothetical protein [Dehalococcoidia bacterium]